MGLIDKLCAKLVEKVNFDKKVIYRRDDDPYLTRYYILPRKRPDWCPGVYLHCFHSSDQDEELHDHPWQKAVSLIIAGSYREELRQEDDSVTERVMKPGCLNFILGDDFHRVDILAPRVWTIFISYKKYKDWGFWNRKTKEYTQWEEFEARKREIYYKKLLAQEAKDIMFDKSQHI